MFKSLKKIIFLSSLLTGVFAVAGFALAATPDLGLSFGEAIGLSNADPRVVASNIIRIALGFLGIIAVGLIVYGGFLWMTAAGNEERIDTAKKLLVSAIIGLVIILSAFAIATFILNKILEATGNGSSEGGPCSTSVNSCVPSSALCQAGLTCGADCLCHGNILPPEPPVDPGGSCGTMTFGTCTQTANCAANSFCGTDCVCHPSTCSSSLDPAVCEVDIFACGAGYYCDNACACQLAAGPGESCDGNLATPECDGAIGSICDPNQNLFCDTTNPDPLLVCTCQPGSGVDQPCGTDPAACSAGQNICSNQLICDVAGASCTCQEAPVINWVSPIGGLCSDDNNKECLADADCGGAPGVTCNLNTPSAAVGNIISVGGRYFGDTPGTILFSDGSGGMIAGQPPAAVNAACASYWSDTQVIIVVPSGAASGPIIIRRPDNKNDATNDSRGARIKDLQINAIIKPGLCLINPEIGKLGASVIYNGVNFSAASAAFGNYEFSIPAKDSSQINPRTVQAGVPSVVAGDTTTFVSNASGQNSNYLEFTKLAEPNTGPYIASFEPQAGASGQYVTIRGSGFGASQGVSKVYFRSVSDYEASYQFPNICADSIWSDKQIIVKVPNGLADNNYYLVISFAGDNEITTMPAVFSVDSNRGLYPSLCKINPVLGQVGTTVNFWGEYFDNADPTNSRVRFSSNRDVFGPNILFWGLDTEASGNPRPDKAEVKVPVGAVSGGVAIVKGSPELAGNSLNFQVGSCLDAADGKIACGGEECCPTGTYKAGSCAANLSDCVSASLTSVYEFDFNTNFNNPNDFFGSCLERSKLLGACSTSACPNSPGLCSLFPAGAQSPVVGSCADESCTSKKGCEAAGSCVYNQSINKCVANPPSACGLSSTTRDILNKEVPTYCAAIKDPVSSNIINRYVFNNSANSCPSGWIKGFNNLASVCIDQKSDAVCAPCRADLTCVPSGLSGVCAAAGDVCPSGSTCQSGECRQNPEASCGCCCRKANVNEDCCAPLACEGTCGSDAGGTDTNTYGSCGGCANVGTTAAEHDAACNCSGTTGKFCDLGDPNFTAGVCRDCAELSTSRDCSDHSASCCVDETKGGSCASRQFGPGESDFLTLINQRNGVAYCGRYECFDEAPRLTVNPIGKSFNTEAEAAVGCGPAPQIGASCAAESAPAKPSADSCNFDICNDVQNIFSCLTDSGAAGAFQLGNNESCGVCCCNPAADRCSALGDNPNLRCQPDVAPSCIGPGRGLCCGCTANADCGDEIAVGCASDACCRARPGVELTMPADGAANICANAELRATFDQQMNTESFSGNVIVVGDYFSEACPPGTAYLAADGIKPAKKNIFAKAAGGLYDLFKKPFNFVFGQESLASDIPVSSHNYCAIAGSVGSEQEGGNKTVLTFRPRNLLKADTKYFVIIKGDADLKNSQESVRSLWDIGMNIIASPVDNTSMFNGINYKGAYIWSFETLPDTTVNPKGICAVDHAKIIPGSYLVQTADNDKNENDSDSANENFDTAADSDKAFTVQALSRNNQILHSVSGYAWLWNWTMENPAVADFVPGVSYNDASGNPITDASKQLIRAITGVTDNRTKAIAAISMIAPTPALDVKASADIYVFICANPWPFVAEGAWAPWVDAGGNCDASGLSCNNFNYELYYCRDNGSGGPNADLPTISDDLTWGEGENALKESFFFREGVPQADDFGLQAAVVPEGEAVDLSWNAIIDPSGVRTVVKYKVYFGDKSGDLKASPQQPAALLSRSLRLSGLQNGKTYYAAVTAVYDNGAESAYSREVSFTPAKTSPPQIPAGLKAEAVPETNNIKVSWLPNTDDTVRYMVYYGISSGQYGSKESVSGRDSSSYTFTPGNANSNYYITVTALDRYNNESAKASEITIQPLR